MKIAARTLVGGTPAKFLRALGSQELVWKQVATASYQHLTERCRETMREVSPLTALDSQRPSLRVPDVRPLRETPRS
jgi:phenylacetic acid degradation protein